VRKLSLGISSPLSDLGSRRVNHREKKEHQYPCVNQFSSKEHHRFLFRCCSLALRSCQSHKHRRRQPCRRRHRMALTRASTRLRDLMPSLTYTLPSANSTRLSAVPRSSWTPLALTTPTYVRRHACTTASTATPPPSA